MLIGLLFLFFSWKSIYLARTGILEYEPYAENICNPSFIMPQFLIERYWIWVRADLTGMAIFVIVVFLLIYGGLMTAAIMILKTFFTAISPEESPWYDSGDRAFAIYMAMEGVIIIALMMLAFWRFLQDTNKTLKKYKKLNEDKKIFNEDALNRVLNEDNSSDDDDEKNEKDKIKHRERKPKLVKKTKEELDKEEILESEQNAMKDQSNALLRAELLKLEEERNRKILVDQGLKNQLTKKTNVVNKITEEQLQTNIERLINRNDQ